jgi:predicted  nucleic acid-binding Zn-ribbon protein
MKKTLKILLTQKNLRNISPVLSILVAGLGIFSLLFLMRMSTDVAWSQEGQPQSGVNIKHEVGFRAQKGYTEYHLLDTWENLKIPIEIPNLGNKLIFTNHSDKKIELTFKFLDAGSRKNRDAFFEFSSKTITLNPKHGLPKSPYAPETLQVIPVLEKIRKEKSEGIEFWVFIKDEIAKIPVTLVESEKGPPPEIPVSESGKDEEKLFLIMKEKTIPLESIRALKIVDKETLLVFKYQGEKRAELRFHFEKAGKTFEEGFKLEPSRISLSKNKPQDTLTLTILSDTLFQKPPSGVELVVSVKDEKPSRIPITFERMRKPGWNSNYVKFQYENQDIREVLTLPFRPEKWKEVQIKNNSGQDISVFYQVAMDSQSVIILDGGEVEVKNNARQSIPWQRKIAGITSGTFKFKVYPADSSLKGFETASVIKVSGPIYWEIGQFFYRNWLKLLLFLLFLEGSGYLLYLQTARIRHLKQQLSGGDSRATKREEEIHKLKHEVAQLKMDKTDLENYITQVRKKQGAGLQRSTPAVETPSRISQDEYEDVQNRLWESESILNEKESELNQKQFELGEKDLQLEKANREYANSLKRQSELTEQITALKSELKQKGEAITRYAQEISTLKKEQNVSDLIEKLSQQVKTEKEELEHKLQRSLTESERKDKYIVDIKRQLEELSERERYLVKENSNLNLELKKTSGEIVSSERTDPT